MDNSVYARLNCDVDDLLRHPQAEALLRLLKLISAPDLRERLNIRFAYSQALYYDRINDLDGVGAPIRLCVPALIASKLPEFAKAICEWPVARVPNLIAKMPLPVHLTMETQDGCTCEVRSIVIRRFVDQQHEVKNAFRRSFVDVEVKFCVYEPGENEDFSAKAFGFESLAAVPESLIVDVCHVASHRKFARPGDVLLTLDSDFNESELSRIGVVAMSPQQFLQIFDPTGLVTQINVQH